MTALDVELIPAFNDNYIHLLYGPDGGPVGVVDPGDAAPVVAVLEDRGWTLDAVFLTHHHGDHIGGVGDLRRRYRPEVFGPASEARRIADLDRGVAEGDRFRFGEEMVQVFETPGHTSGHIAYWFPQSRLLFCGDTLFALGCGRLFEGTAAQMWHSLGKLRALPDDTRVYCGHEYTQSNARFALTIEPGNADLQARARAIDETRGRGAATIPTTIGDEKRTNPFLRADVPELQTAIGLTGHDPVEVFATVRARKDGF